MSGVYSRVYVSALPAAAVCYEQTAAAVSARRQR